MQSITVTEKGANTKIEQYLQTIYPNLSFGTMQKAFRRRDIKANGARISKDYVVAQGDRLEIFITDELLNGARNTDHGNTGRTAQNSKFSVVYEDNDLIIVNKAQGIPVHPDKEQTQDTLISLVRKYLREKNRHTEQGHTNQGHTDQGHIDQGYTEQGHTEQGHTEQNHTEQGHTEHNHAESNRPADDQSTDNQSTDNQSAADRSSSDDHALESSNFQPALCHRLDRNTGGLVIIAKNPASHDFILEKLESREIKKYYQCLVKGKMEKKEARLQAYLWKDAAKSRVIISDHKKQGSQEILTAYKVLEYDQDKDVSRLEVELVTGRTHQIRAHLAYIGHPIIGDGKYGTNAINRAFGLKQQALWACRLKFDFAKANKPLEYSKLLKNNKLPEANKSLKDNKLPEANKSSKDNKLPKDNTHLNEQSSLNNLNGKEFIVYPEFTMKLKS